MRTILAVFVTLSLAMAADEPATVLALGDSLTAGYGLEESQAWPALAQATLREQGQAVRIINAGVSGDTTGGGLARLDWLLKSEPDLVVIALGANDGLRGLPIETIAANLGQLIERCRAAGARVALAGMRLPRNYGSDYGQAFAAVFPAVAAEHGVPLLPFLLDGVAMDPALNLADGIHPNVAGQERVAASMVAFLTPLLAEEPE